MHQGLGITVDENALTAYRVDASTPTPHQLFRESEYTCRVHIPDGSGGETVHDFSGEDVYYPAFSAGRVSGVRAGDLDGSGLIEWQTGSKSADT